MNYSELNQLSISELSMLNSRVVEVIKMKRKQTSLEKKFELQVGMEVKVNHSSLTGVKLMVGEIRRTKAVVRTMNGFKSYNVPISMIEIC